ncbi:hypothetical protein Nepgr_031188 [Nepenthes gracilis]|uniref:Endonuclease/exonuclease/phosphatase domain-containing protein n=1 Tax=Nepenthes gracilis TaxID=150966 RepID=A0AAD3TG83_NEPGR|nr:hypothetical protein Nepgr_031188 [Nepenthes gracilis]
MLFSSVYGANDEVKHRTMWNSLEAISKSVQQRPWVLLLGDFNVVISPNEILGGGFYKASAKAFGKCILNCLKSPGFYTWGNRRETSDFTIRKLDRILVNNDWIADISQSFGLFSSLGIFEHSNYIFFWCDQE